MVEGQIPVVEAKQKIGERLIVDPMGGPALEMVSQIIGEIPGRARLKRWEIGFAFHWVPGKTFNKSREGIAGKPTLPILDPSVPGPQGQKGIGGDEGIA